MIKKIFRILYQLLVCSILVLFCYFVGKEIAKIIVITIAIFVIGFVIIQVIRKYYTNIKVIYLRDICVLKNDRDSEDIFSENDGTDNKEWNVFNNNQEINKNDKTLVNICISDICDELYEYVNILNKYSIYSIVKTELIGLDHRFSLNVIEDYKEKAIEIITKYKNKSIEIKFFHLLKILKCENCNSNTLTEAKYVAGWKKLIYPDSKYLICSKCFKQIRVVME